MTMASENFISKFDNLEGVTLAQRRRNFSKLLRENSSLVDKPEILDIITSNLQPKTYFQELLKLEFLIYFRRTSELYKLLKEGSDVVCSKIVKQKWFFKTLFNQMDAEELVNDVLPSLSYSVRMKILNRISRNLDSQHFDKIFDLVMERYGIFIALQFITGCSSSKIHEIMTSHPVELNSKELLILYKKSPDIIDLYFSMKQRDHRKYSSLFKFIMFENLELYNNLTQKHCKRNISFSLGRRRTKRFVSLNKDNIINKPYVYKYTLNMPAVLRKLGRDSVELFCNDLPNRKNYTSSSIFASINMFPKRYHYTLYMKIIPQHYNIKYVDHPEFIIPHILGVIRDNQERASLANIKVQSGADEFIKFLEPADAIPLIQQKIKLTHDIQLRAQLVCMLLETCKINNDLGHLLQIIKYFNSRHKNDDQHVHHTFLNQLQDPFYFRNFTEEMWNLLYDLLKINILKFHQKSPDYEAIQNSEFSLVKSHTEITNSQKLTYMEFLYNRNKPIDDLIWDYLSSDFSYPDCKNYSKNFCKHFLMYVIENAPKIKKDRDSTVIKIIQELIWWNKNYLDDQISFFNFTQLVNIFDEIVEKEDNHYVLSVAKKILTKEVFVLHTNERVDKYRKIYWDQFKKFGCKFDILWFLKYEPNEIVVNLEKSINLSLQLKDSNIFYVVKKYSHLDLDRKTIEFCLLSLKNDKVTEKSGTVKCLSILLSPEQYLNLVADPYKPSNETLNLDNKESVKLYDVRCQIAKSFKNTKSLKLLAPLFNYCVGDYFSSALISLSSLLYRTPEKELPPLLDRLAKNPHVSIRKHALFLTCELCDLSAVQNSFSTFHQTEKDESIQKRIFQSCIQYFIKNPFDKCFELVKLNMSFIKKDSDESLSDVVDNVRKIPKRYKVNYILHAWEILEKVMEQKYKLKNFKNKLVNDLSMEDFKELPLDFAINVIQENFLQNSEFVLKKSIGSEFTYCFLLATDNKAEVLKIILDIVSGSTNKDIFWFFSNWYDKIIISNYNDGKNFKAYLDFWQSRLTPIEHFPYYLQYCFLKIKFDCTEDENFIDSICKKIPTIVNDLVTSYGFAVLEFIVSNVKDLIDRIVKTDFERYRCLETMIDVNPTPAVAIFIIRLLSFRRKEHVEGWLYPTYERILEKIKNIEDDGVKINFNSNFTLNF